MKGLDDSTKRKLMKEADDLLHELFPFCRSITGPGLRDTLEIAKKKAFFEIKYASVIIIDKSITDKKVISKIVLCDLQKIVYPKIQKIFLNLIKDSGYPNIKFDKDVDFEKMYNEKFN